MRRLGDALPTVLVVTSLDGLLPGQAALLDNGTDPPRLVRKRLDGSVPAFANAVSEWPVFVGQMTPTPINGGFFRLPLSAVTDTHGGFSPATHLYEVKQAGIYRLEMKIRYNDGTPGGISIGLGAGTAEIDDPSFLWGVTVTTTAGTPRNGLLNQRIAQFAAGDQVRLYTYCDDLSGTQRYATAGELTIDRIR